MTSIKPHSICAFIVKKDGNEWKYLLLRRNGKYLAGNWQMVSGGIDEGETAIQAAYREIVEETGLKPARLYSADTVEVFFHPPSNSIMMNAAFVAFIDTEQNIVLSAHEHDAYQWYSFQDAYEILEFAEQKRILLHVQEYFIEQMPNERFLIQSNS